LAWSKDVIDHLYDLWGDSTLGGGEALSFTREFFHDVFLLVEISHVSKNLVNLYLFVIVVEVPTGVVLDLGV